MIETINNLLDNLFNTHIIELYCGNDIFFSLDISFWFLFFIIFISCIVVSSIFMWFFHIIFERCYNDC